MTREIELDLARLRQAYEAGVQTPSSVVSSILGRISARGDDGIWLSLLPEEDIRERAAALESMDREARERLPLWGVPFAVKDNIDLAGCPTTAACPAFSYLPRASAASVEKLVAAGAIPIGKTNLDQFATGLVGTRTPFTVPVNPFDSSYVTGGSSSGSAAALAHGLVSFALGTDTAGSGRVPAGFCNVVGLKPTRGRISTTGLVPASRSIDCISIFAFTVSDAMQVLRSIEGEDARDPYSRAAPASMSRRAIGTTFRFGIPGEGERLKTADEAADLRFRAAIDRLVLLGGTPVEVDFAPFAEAASLLYGPLVAERLADLEDFLTAQPDAVHPVTRQILESGRPIAGTAVFKALHRLGQIGAGLDRLWQDLDCLVVPTFPRPVRLAELDADPIGPNSMLGTYTNFVNLLDFSAIAVPAGFDAHGVPHGVTFIGPAFAENALAPLTARFQAQGGLPLGATSWPLPLQAAEPLAGDFIPLAVFGAHLSGERLNHQLLDLGGIFERTCRTAPHYRLFSLPDGRPGLLRQTEGGTAIAGEIWNLPPAGFGRFAASIPAPLGIGRVNLDDGSAVAGFLCEAYATAGTPDISHFGGWRAWRDSLS